MEEEKKFQHPEGKIQLLDGRVLDCYQSQRLKCEPVSNELEIDTSGVYLSMKKPSGSRPVKDEREDEEKELERLFLSNAFVLLDNRERILSDSRMFLCPLPIRNGLAYTGTSGFHHPTLGIYIEFWLHCPAATVMKDNGEKWLLWHIAGSPLSGSNRCSLVNSQGEWKCEQVSSFSGIWRPFMEINSRYDEAKSKYDAYTLRQVLSILENEGTKVAYEKSTHIFFLEQTIKKLKKEIHDLRRDSNRLYGKYRYHLLNEKRSELEAFFTEYQAKREDMRNKLDEIQVQRMKLRKQMREGEIDHLQYQRLWMPIHKEKNNIQADLRMYEMETLHEIVPDFFVSAYDVEQFLKEKK